MTQTADHDVAAGPPEGAASLLRLTLVVGEKRADLALPGHRTTPFASLGAEAAARTIACTSPSKAFNLAGLQVANILIADERLREALAVADPRLILVETDAPFLAPPPFRGAGALLTVV